MNIVRNASTDQAEAEAADERAELLIEIRRLAASVDELRAEIRSRTATG